MSGVDANVDKALESISGSLSNIGFVTGSYTGNGGGHVAGTLRFINIGFTPKFVIVVSTNGVMATLSGTEVQLAGMATTGSPVRYDASNVVLECVTNGFNTRNYYTQALNRDSYTYNYIAFK